jgi:hypothetical protein
VEQPPLVASLLEVTRVSRLRLLGGHGCAAPQCSLLNEDLPDKGKPIERWGRKAMGLCSGWALRCRWDMTARLPKGRWIPFRGSDPEATHDRCELSHLPSTDEDQMGLSQAVPQPTDRPVLRFWAFPNESGEKTGRCLT